MTKEEFKVKTAQLAGYDLEECEIGDDYFEVPLDEHFYADWNPEENLEQAMEVLTSLEKKDCKWMMSPEDEYEDDYYCEIGVKVRENSYYHHEGYGQTVEKAICNAVEKYLEGEG